MFYFILYYYYFILTQYGYENNVLKIVEYLAKKKS